MGYSLWTLLSDYHTHTLSQTLTHVGPDARATEQLASPWAATCLSLLSDHPRQANVSAMLVYYVLEMSYHLLGVSSVSDLPRVLSRQSLSEYSR